MTSYDTVWCCVKCFAERHFCWVSQIHFWGISSVALQVRQLRGAVTLSMLTFSTMTLRIKGINVTQQSNTLPLCWVSHFIYCCAECHHAECVMLIVIMLRVVEQSLVMRSRGGLLSLKLKLKLTNLQSGKEHFPADESFVAVKEIDWKM